MPNDYPPGQTAPSPPLPPAGSDLRKALLATIGFEFVFTRKNPPVLKEFSLPGESEGDMTFQGTTYPKKNSKCIETSMTAFNLSGRCFHLDDIDTPVTLLFNDFQIKSSPGDRYSNGEIISTTDLLGSTLQIKVCPYAVSKEINHNFGINKLDIIFPGQQLLTIEDGLKKVQIDSCNVYSYVFPNKPEDFKKMFQVYDEGVE